jgi:hypothetical protein
MRPPFAHVPARTRTEEPEQELQCASFDSIDQAIQPQRANLHAAIAVSREGGYGSVKNTDSKTTDLVVRLSNALMQETDGTQNEEKEPDALYLWTRA